MNLLGSFCNTSPFVSALLGSAGVAVPAPPKRVRLVAKRRRRVPRFRGRGGRSRGRGFGRGRGGLGPGRGRGGGRRPVARVTEVYSDESTESDSSDYSSSSEASDRSSDEEEEDEPDPRGCSSIAAQQQAPSRHRRTKSGQERGQSRRLRETTNEPLAVVQASQLINNKRQVVIDEQKVADWEWVRSLENPRDMANRAVPGQWTSIRVFISSTFVDTHGERDILIKEVFPEVNNRIKDRYVRLLPVDLRWGVTKDETATIQSLCLDQIDGCRSAGDGLPWFISLRTKRHGWIQSAYQRPAEFQCPQRLGWLKSFDETVPTKPLSITAMETYHAFLGQQTRRSRSRAPHSFFMFRDDSQLMAKCPNDKKWIFDNELRPAKGGPRVANNKDMYTFTEDFELHTQTKQLMDTAIRQSKLPKTVFDYSCTFKSAVVSGRTGSKSAVGTVGGLDAFRDHLIEQLTESVRAEHPDPGFLDHWDLEQARHQAFITDKSDGFVGRFDTLDRIRPYISGSNEKGQVLVVTGEAGMGKSCVMAKVAESLGAEGGKLLVLSHFVGASRTSMDLHDMLHRFCHTLKKAVPSIEEQIPTDLDKLTKDWMAVFAEKAGQERSVFILIDGVDQLLTESMGWLPPKLPSNVKVILSMAEQDYTGEGQEGKRAVRLVNLERAQTPIIELLQPLTKDKAGELVESYLARYHKKLTSATDGSGQLELLLAKREASLPLYLVAAADALRTFGVYEQLTEYLRRLPDSVEALFRARIKEIEKDHGPVVRAVLTLLGCSRLGLLESDLIEILATKDLSAFGVLGKGGSFSRLFSAIEPLLAPTGSGLINFFHGRLMRVVQEVFKVGPNNTDRDEHQKGHEMLALYYMDIIKRHLSGDEQSSVETAMSESIFHLLQAEKPRRARNGCLLSMDWLVLRLARSTPNALLGDLDMFLGQFPRDAATSSVREAIYKSSFALSLDARQLPVQLTARLMDKARQDDAIKGLLLGRTSSSSSSSSYSNQGVSSVVSKHTPVVPYHVCVQETGGAELMRLDKARLSGLAAVPSLQEDVDLLDANHRGGNNHEPYERPTLSFSFLPGGGINVVAVDGGVQLCELKGHTREPFGIRSFQTPTTRDDEYAGLKALSWGNDGEVLYWDLEAAIVGSGAAQLIGRLKLHADPLLAPECEHAKKVAEEGGKSDVKGPNASGVVSCLAGAVAIVWVGCAVVVWDLENAAKNGTNHKVLRTEDTKIADLKLMPGATAAKAFNCRAVSWAGDEATLWDINTIIKEIRSEQVPEGELSHVSLPVEVDDCKLTGVLPLAEGRSLVVWSKQGKFWMFNLQPVIEAKQGESRDPKRLLLGPCHTGEVKGAVRCGEDHMLTWDNTCELFYWNLSCHKKHPFPTAVKLVGHVSAIEGITLFAAGRKAISFGRDRNMHIWNLRVAEAEAPDAVKPVYHKSQDRGLYKFPMKGHSDWVEGITVFAKQTRAISFSRDKTVVLWDLSALQRQNLDYDTQQTEALESKTVFKRPKLSAGRGRGFKGRGRGRGRGGSRGGARGPVVRAPEAPKGGGAPGGMFRRKARGGKGKRAKKTPPLKSSPCVKLRGHLDWARGVRLFRDEQWALSWGGNDLMMWDLSKAEGVLSAHKRQTGGQKSLEDKLAEKLALIPVPMCGHAARVADVAVFTAADSSYHALSLGKDRILIEWDLDVQQIIGEAREHTVRSAMYNAEIAKSRASKGAGNKKKSDKEEEGGDEAAKDKKVDREREKEDAKAANPLFARRAGHSKWITGIKFFAGGSKAISWGKDNLLVVWDMELEKKQATVGEAPRQGGFVMSLAGHNDRVRGLTVFDNDTKVMSWSLDPEIIVWDLTASRPGRPALKKMTGHTDVVLGVKLLDGNARALSFSRDQSLIMWDMHTGKAITRMTGHEKWIRGAMVVPGLPEGDIVSWCDDTTMKVWKFGGETAVRTLEGHTAKILGVRGIALDQSRGAPMTHLLSYGADGLLLLWPLSGGSHVALEGHTDWVNGLIPLSFGSDREPMLLSWSRDGTLKLWPLTQALSGGGAPASTVTLQQNMGIVSGASVTGNASMVVSFAQGCSDILLWDLRAAVRAGGDIGHSGCRRLRGVHKHAVARCSLYAGDRRVLSNDTQSFVGWDIKSLTSLWTVTFDATISAFSVDQGHQLLLADSERTVRSVSHIMVGHTDGQVSQIGIGVDSVE